MSSYVKTEDLEQVFEGSQNAISEMERVFKQHKDIETVILNPDSWVGKELLSLNRRLIDVQGKVHDLKLSINRIERFLDKLFDDAQ